MTFSIVLGLLSAVLFALAGALQHSVTRPVAQSAAAAGWLPVLGMVQRLLRHPIWLCGLLANVLGFVAHAAALHTGSITIVQALLSVQLMLALPISARRTGRAPSTCDWLGAAAICAGLATLVLVRGDVPQTFARQGLTPFVAIAALTVMVTLIALARWIESARTVLIGAAAGTGFSLTAVFIVLVTDRLTLFDWSTVGLALSGLIAAVIAQDAYASGSLPTAMTVMIVTDPLMSWIWGAILFDSRPPTSLTALSGLVVSGALITCGGLWINRGVTLAT